MHASTRNLVTCSAPRCPQPATVTVHRVVDSATRRGAVSGEPVPIEVEVDYCQLHAPEDD